MIRYPSRRFRPGRTALPLLVALLVVAISGCREETPAVTARFDAFDAQVDLNLVRVNPARAELAIAELKADFRFLETTLDPWRNGPMTRVNRLLPTGKPFVAPPALMPVLRLARSYAERSDNLFNPAIGRLVALWGFNASVPECQPPPRERSIRRLVAADPTLSDIRIEGLELVGDNPALMLDFGAMVKGYAIDLAIDRLRELGVRDALVRIGRTLRAIGDRSGQPWRIPVRRATGSAVLGMVQIRGDGAMATVVAADHTFIYGRVTYHSVLDPRTGWPAEDTLAVTVLHRDAATADAAATALFVAGPMRWHEVAQAMGVQLVLLVDGRGTLHMSPEMRERIELIDSDASVVLSAPLSGAADGSGATDTGAAGRR